MAQSSSCQSTVVFCINFLFKFHMLLDSGVHDWKLICP